MSLPQTTASAAQARRELGRFAGDNDLVGRAGVALLVLSELVTNAVLHGAEPIQVCVRREPDALRIEVADGDDRTDGVVLRSRGPDLTGGRGLHIVNALARSWGVTKSERGKTVWAEVAVDDD